MPRPTHLTLVEAEPLSSTADAFRNPTLELLRRIRNGWQPDAACLAGARHAESWTVNREPNAMAYQFVGWPSESASPASIIIASVIALDPAESWALLFGERWVTLGTRAPETAPFDPNDVIVRAEAWLRGRGR